MAVVGEGPPPEEVDDPDADGPSHPDQSSGLLSLDGNDEWRRHPSDVTRLVLSGLVLLVLLAAAEVAPQSLRQVSADLLRSIGRLPSSVRDLIVGLAQILTLVAPVVLIVAAGFKRWRELLLMVFGGFTAAGIMFALHQWLDRVVPARVVEQLDDDAWVANASFPSASYLAGFAAIVTILAPTLSRGWRRVGWASVALAALIRLLSATQAPVNLGVTLAVGVVVGSAVLVIFGAPFRRPDRRLLDEAQERMGLSLDDLHEADDGAGRTFLGAAGDRQVRLECVGRDERDEDLLFQAWRKIRVKGIADESPGWTPVRRAQHEALVTLMAAEAGASVPRVLGVYEAEDGETVIAVEQLDAQPLDERDPDTVDDPLLRRVWHQVDLLHDHRLAHRQLDANRVLVDPRGEVHLSDLSGGQLSADRTQMASDVAELLVSTALLVGPDRAVAAAAAELDADDLVAAVPLVQPLALTEATRKAVKKRDKGLLDDVRSELSEAACVEDVELAEITRLSVGSLMSAVGLVVLLLFAVGLASNWSEIADAVKDADWAYLPAILLMMVLTYVGGAISLVGSVLRPLSLVDSTVVMFGQAFLNRFTPANAGGMAMRIRYLQKGGTDVTLATASVGLTSLASGAAQVVLLVVFIGWSGSTAGGGELISGDVNVKAIIVLLVAAVLGVVLGVPPIRRKVLPWAKQTLAKLRDLLSGLLRRPSKLLALFGGATLSKFAFIFAFILSCRAFGVTLGLAELGALYLTANTVASAVPTPGGVGAIEAALVAVLTGAGVDSAAAWGATLLFRLVTYWLPTLPGWLALKYCERKSLV